MNATTVPRHLSRKPPIRVNDMIILAFVCQIGEWGRAHIMVSLGELQ